MRIASGSPAPPDRAPAELEAGLEAALAAVRPIAKSAPPS
jgi:hypothetical protein